MGDAFWQELERDKAMQPRVLGLAAPTELFQDAVVRDGLTDHVIGQS